MPIELWKSDRTPHSGGEETGIMLLEKTLRLSVESRGGRVKTRKSLLWFKLTQEATANNPEAWIVRAKAGGTL